MQVTKEKNSSIILSSPGVKVAKRALFLRFDLPPRHQSGQCSCVQFLLCGLPDPDLPTILALATLHTVAVVTVAELDEARRAA